MRWRRLEGPRSTACVYFLRPWPPHTGHVSLKSGARGCTARRVFRGRCVLDGSRRPRVGILEHLKASGLAQAAGRVSVWAVGRAAVPREETKFIAAGSAANVLV
jgi:hypothetical protein